MRLGFVLFFSLLHLKPEACLPFFVFVSHESESGIKIKD